MRFTTTILSVLVLAAGLGACGGDDEAGPAASGATGATGQGGEGKTDTERCAALWNQVGPADSEFEEVLYSAPFDVRVSVVGGGDPGTPIPRSNDVPDGVCAVAIPELGGLIVGEGPDGYFHFVDDVRSGWEGVQNRQAAAARPSPNAKLGTDGQIVLRGIDPESEYSAAAESPDAGVDQTGGSVSAPLECSEFTYGGRSIGEVRVSQTDCDEAAGVIRSFLDTGADAADVRVAENWTCSNYGASGPLVCQSSDGAEILFRTLP